MSKKQMILNAFVAALMMLAAAIAYTIWHEKRQAKKSASLAMTVDTTEG